MPVALQLDDREGTRGFSASAGTTGCGTSGKRLNLVVVAITGNGERPVTQAHQASGGVALAPNKPWDQLQDQGVAQASPRKQLGCPRLQLLGCRFALSGFPMPY